MYTLRYYAPHFERNIHEQILNHLEQARVKFQIPYEIVEIRLRKSEYSDTYYADEEHEKEIYERDFKPRKAVLKQRIGESIRRALRSRSGGYFVAGAVAIVRDEQVEWFTSYANQFKEYDANYIIAFLKAVLDKGPILLDQLCPEIKKGEGELKILDNFIRSSVLRGKFQREVKVGSRIFKSPEGTFDWRKSIDAVCYTEDEVWILEGKNRLDYKALGEVLTYACLFERQYPERKIRMGIVCGAIDEEILEVCRKYGVTVFEVIAEQVKIH